MSDLVITRVVIACDPVGENRSSVIAAARVAAWLNAALHGVFVEDESLLHLAAMPFARQVGASGAAFEAIDERAILHQFEAHARRARAALEAAARTHELGWSFNVVRGPSQLGTLGVGEQDLLVIESASRPFAGAFRLDSRWLAAALRSHRPILLVQSSGRALPEVSVLVQKSGAAADRLIAAAVRLALAGDNTLTVLLAQEAPDAAAAREKVRAISEPLAARCRIERVSLSAPAFDHAAGEGSLLIVDADPAVNDAKTLKELAAKTRADMLFLR